MKPQHLAKGSARNSPLASPDFDALRRVVEAEEARLGRSLTDDEIDARFGDKAHRAMKHAMMEAENR